MADELALVASSRKSSSIFSVQRCRRFTQHEMHGKQNDVRKWIELCEVRKLRYEVFDDGRTVWVNASDGSNIARFGRMGIDVHNPATEQMSGAPLFAM